MSDAVSLNGLEQAAPHEEFTQEVRRALVHLFDYTYLQNHPLAFQLPTNSAQDNVTRAQHLRRTLLDCIERLRPQGQAHPDVTRAYAVLSYRCVDGLSMEEIEQKLALSRRQTYRDYSKGVDAIASQLWDMIASHALPSQASAATLQPATSERGQFENLRNEVHLENIQLSDVVNGVCNLLRHRTQERAIAILLSLPPGLQINADRTLLRQSLLSLLGQALDWLAAAGQITITARHIDAQILLQIEATPVDPVAKSASTQFASAQPAALLAPAEEEPSLAQTLIEAQGGTLTFVRNHPEHWQSEITLPVASANLNPIVLRPTVLLVDDNDDLLALFRRYLAGHNVNVTSASGSRNAFELAANLRPNLVVLDVMMPYADGWDILQALRNDERTQQTPVMICSVLKERGLALSLGADDYLCKPVSQPQLVAALQRWLGTLHPLA